MGTLGTNLRQPAYGEPERDERWFRYSVKCERTFAMRLEAAAAKAGKSVNAFVQAHFETILQPRAAAEARAFDARAFDPVRFARENVITPPAARVWATLRRHVDMTGQSRRTLYDIEHETGLPLETIRSAMAELKDRGLIEQTSGAGTKGRTYRVMG